MPRSQCHKIFNAVTLTSTVVFGIGRKTFVTTPGLSNLEPQNNMATRFKRNGRKMTMIFTLIA